MKKGFTLVELLVVVVVLVTLMTITFRIGNIGDDTSKRNTTINRMQRLENCLSGYYAAYGSYPPVRLHGSRDYRLPADNYGIQDTDAAPETELNWTYVQAACRAQPMAMNFPFPRSKKDYIEAVSRARIAAAKDPNPKNNFTALVNSSMVSGKTKQFQWAQVQIFKFGVMSYLLPRYVITMGGGSNGNSTDIDSDFFDKQEQWRANNELPCRFETGVPYESWSQVRNDLAQRPWMVTALPSQAACARWLPNLEESLATSYNREIYGIKLQAPNSEGANSKFEIYDASANGSQGKGNGGGGQNYALNMMTMADGWGEEFYYYSLPPHQSYTIWSSGPNRKTFPPWVDLKDVEKQYHKTVQSWVMDDITQMSN